MKQGIYGYKALSNSAYHESDGVSSSQLKNMLKAPAIAEYDREHPRGQTKSQLLGSAVHSLALTPDLDEVVTAPLFNARTKQGKQEAEAFHAEHAGKYILSPDESTLVTGMVESLTNHPMARILLSDGVPEGSRYWIDEQTSELCKMRHDYYNGPHNVLVDLKTASDASRNGFLRACVNFRYDLSAEYYMEGMRRTGADPREFIFVVVENNPPHLVGIYTLPPELKNKGNVTWRRALDIWHQCRQTNSWPGYPEEIQVLDAPQWALRD